MIDLHNHILYDWDDGPATLDKTLEMARQAVTVGTTIMAATPHRRWNGGESRPDQVRRRVREVNDIFALNGILLTLVPGIEIPIEPGMASDLMRGDVSTIGDGKYALVEPPFTELPEHLLPSIKEVIDAGYGVVIAHPERNSYVQKSVAIGKSLDFLSSCADLGCVIQLTSGSIIGRFGSSALAASKQIIAQHSWRLIVASDSHDTKDRSPAFLAKAQNTIAEWTGNEVLARTMVDDLPLSILNS